jgi:hypothetical protein
LNPGIAHRPNLARGFCLCEACRAEIRATRCPFVFADGQQCGDYRRHPGLHTRLVATIFLP